MKEQNDPPFPYLGCIPDADGYACLSSECGDTLEVFLSVRDRTIRKARFEALGCGLTMVCGNAAMELAENKTLAEAFRVGAQDISERVDGLDPDHFHCAELAAETLRTALHDCLAMGDTSWKRLYRTRTSAQG